MNEKSVAFFIDNKIPFIALHDGEVYIGDTKEMPNKTLQEISPHSASKR